MDLELNGNNSKTSNLMKKIIHVFYHLKFYEYRLNLREKFFVMNRKFLMVIYIQYYEEITV